ncbi:hypothetical protein D3C71_1935760 [compost metagenome]
MGLVIIKLLDEGFVVEVIGVNAGHIQLLCLFGIIPDDPVGFRNSHEPDVVRQRLLAGQNILYNLHTPLRQLQYHQKIRIGLFLQASQG